MVGRILDAVVLILYPAIVVAGLTYLGVRWTALILLLVIGRRIIVQSVTNREGTRIILYQALAMAAIIGFAAISQSPFALRVAPFIISLTFITVFTTSLRTTPIIERFARLKTEALSPEEVGYCRKLTKVWVGVLFANSVLVLTAAFIEDKLLWTILVGPASYALLGSVFVVEYPYRKWRFRDFNEKSAVDKLLKHLIEGKAALQ
jgi:uncharacterized membrane protein